MAGQQGETLRRTKLYDDPLNLSGTLLTLKNGQRLRALFKGRDSWYVEVRYKGRTYRGFIRIEDGAVGG